MELHIVGGGKVRLGRADFVAQGGEASIYARGDVAYKVYTDPGRMLPPAKIQELSVLTHPEIIRPEALLLDARNRPVGYTMRRVQDAHVLCQLFNRAFRERSGITPEAMVALVRKLQQGVQHVHAQGILIVDLNEMNFLLDARLREVLFIDVDSYQTPGFAATAIMDSIRDRHAAGFGIETDWFSFGIVSFQMFAGIHPYRGKHPSLHDLDARMLRNVSVLNPQVAVPQVCYPFSVIPPSYLDWYRAVFEEGKRVPPPSDLRPVITIIPTVEHLPESEHLRVRELCRFPADIIAAVPAGGGYAAVTAAGLFVGGQKYDLGADVRLGVTPRMNHLVAARIVGRKLRLYDVTGSRPLSEEIEGEALTVYEGRIYVKTATTLSELQFIELPGGLRAALKAVGTAMEQATQLFDGMAVQSVLGSFYVSLFPRLGACCSIRLPELGGYRVVDARFENNVLMIVGTKEGRYDRFVLRFDAQYAGYDIRVIRDVAYSGLNFVVLDSGICVHLNENEELELFLNRKGSENVRLITDRAVRGVRLFKNGTQALFSRGDRLYGMRMQG